MELSKAALSHNLVLRQTEPAWQLPDGPVSPYKSFLSPSDDALRATEQTPASVTENLVAPERDALEGIPFSPANELPHACNDHKDTLVICVFCVETVW